MSDCKQSLTSVKNNRTYEKRCTFVFKQNHQKPEKEKITSVLIFVFLDETNIVLTVNKRGLDIPGGHIEEDDKSFEETAHRETLEETGTTIKDIEYFGALESDYFGSTQDSLTYILLYAAKVDKIYDYTGNLECKERQIMDYEEFLNNYTGKILDTAMMKELVQASRKVLGYH